VHCWPGVDAPADYIKGGGRGHCPAAQRPAASLFFSRPPSSPATMSWSPLCGAALFACRRRVVRRGRLSALLFFFFLLQPAHT